MRYLLLSAAFLALVAGCFGTSKPEVNPNELGLADQPLHLPLTDFFDRVGRPAYSGGPLQGMTPVNPPVPFHAYDEIVTHVQNYTAQRPDLVRLDVVGVSRQGRPIFDVVLTNHSAPVHRPHVLIDGGHHGNEIAGTELVMYTVDFLLGNFETNATIRQLFETLEMHFVPLLNPDGYVAQTRGNALGVNLNRNYDIDWGDPYGASNPVMGKVSATTGQPVQSVPIVAENCGDAPFSEPETQAMRDLMDRLQEDFALYFTLHTPTNGIIAPWAAGMPPFDLSANESRLFEAELEWVRANTEYAAGKAEWGNFSAGLPYSASGSSMDWAFMRHHAAGYTLEIEIWITSIVDPDYVARNLAPYSGLEYWMKASLPIMWHLLLNAENSLHWDLPTKWVPLPEGVPPPVPAGGWESLRELGMVKPGGEGPD